jgi:hypothetical protein
LINLLTPKYKISGSNLVTLFEMFSVHLSTTNDYQPFETGILQIVTDFITNFDLVEPQSLLIINEVQHLFNKQNDIQSGSDEDDYAENFMSDDFTLELESEEDDQSTLNEDTSN